MSRHPSRCLGFLVVSILSANACMAGTLTITTKSLDFTNSGFNAAQQAVATNLYLDAGNAWTATLYAPVSFNVFLTINKVVFKDLGANMGGNTIGASADANGMPQTVNEIDISTNAVMFYNADISKIQATQKDAYSVMLHELGHALGFDYLDNGDGYQRWNNRIIGTDFKLTDGTLVTMAGADANGLSHIADAYAVDLMNLSVGLGQRRGISDLDLCMLQAAFGYDVCPEPSSFVLASTALCVVVGYARRKRRAA